MIVPDNLALLFAVVLANDASTYNLLWRMKADPQSGGSISLHPTWPMVPSSSIPSPRVSRWGGYSAWPGLAQVFCLQRQVITKKHAQERRETVYGVTSMATQRATPAQLLAWVRGHWHIENKSHGVRDVTFDAGRSQVRCGHLPHVMAAIRNTAIGLLRAAGYTNIAKAYRQMAAQPQRALALIGIEIENCIALAKGLCARRADKNVLSCSYSPLFIFAAWTRGDLPWSRPARSMEIPVTLQSLAAGPQAQR